MASPLSPTDRDRLTQLCEIVRDGLQTFIEVGSALMEIRDKKLWRGLADTFEDFVIAEFGISKSYASRQIAAAETVELLTSGPEPELPNGNTEGLSEGLLRPVAELVPEVQAETFREAAKAAEEAGETLSRKHTEAAAENKPRKRVRSAAQDIRARERKAEREAKKRAEEAPEPEATEGGGSTDELVKGAEAPDGLVPVTSEVGEPTGASAPSTEAVREGDAVSHESSLDRTRYSLAAEYVTSLPDAPVCPPSEHRAAFHVLPTAEIERARALHRWLGTFLLQVDMERDNARKASAA